MSNSDKLQHINNIIDKFELYDMSNIIVEQALNNCYTISSDELVKLSYELNAISATVDSSESQYIVDLCKNKLKKMSNDLNGMFEQVRANINRKASRKLTDANDLAEVDRKHDMVKRYGDFLIKNVTIANVAVNANNSSNPNIAIKDNVNTGHKVTNSNDSVINPNITTDDIPDTLKEIITNEVLSKLKADASFYKKEVNDIDKLNEGYSTLHNIVNRSMSKENDEIDDNNLHTRQSTISDVSYINSVTPEEYRIGDLIAHAINDEQRNALRTVGIIEGERCILKKKRSNNDIIVSITTKIGTITIRPNTSLETPYINKRAVEISNILKNVNVNALIGGLVELNKLQSRAINNFFTVNGNGNSYKSTGPISLTRIIDTLKYMLPILINDIEVRNKAIYAIAMNDHGKVFKDKNGNSYQIATLCEGKTKVGAFNRNHDEFAITTNKSYSSNINMSVAPINGNNKAKVIANVDTPNDNTFTAFLYRYPYTDNYLSTLEKEMLNSTLNNDRNIMSKLAYYKDYCWNNPEAIAPVNTYIACKFNELCNIEPFKSSWNSDVYKSNESFAFSWSILMIVAFRNIIAAINRCVNITVDEYHSEHKPVFAQYNSKSYDDFYKSIRSIANDMWYDFSQVERVNHPFDPLVLWCTTTVNDDGDTITTYSVKYVNITHDSNTDSCYITSVDDYTVNVKSCYTKHDTLAKLFDENYFDICFPCVSRSGVKFNNVISALNTLVVNVITQQYTTDRQMVKILFTYILQCIYNEILNIVHKKLDAIANDMPEPLYTRLDTSSSQE